MHMQVYTCRLLVCPTFAIVSDQTCVSMHLLGWWSSYVDRDAETEANWADGAMGAGDAGRFV